MKVRIVLLVNVLLVLFTASSLSQEAETEEIEEADARHFAIGAYGSVGGAKMFLDKGTSDISYDPEFRFAGGGGGYVDFYINDFFALDAGLELLGKGDRDGQSSGQTRKILYLAVPLGMKFNIVGFHLGLGVDLDFALKGKLENRYMIVEFREDDWDSHKRFNFCLRASIAYAISIGPIAIVPGIVWSGQMLNNADGDLADQDVEIRYMNIMVNLGVEFGF